MQDVLRLVEACFTKAKVEKTRQNKAVILEREFGMDKVQQFLPLCNQTVMGKTYWLRCLKREHEFSPSTRAIIAANSSALLVFE